MIPEYSPCYYMSAGMHLAAVPHNGEKIGITVDCNLDNGITILGVAESDPLQNAPYGSLFVHSSPAFEYSEDNSKCRFIGMSGAGNRQNHEEDAVNRPGCVIVNF